MVNQINIIIEKLCLFYFKQTKCILGKVSKEVIRVYCY